MKSLNGLWAAASFLLLSIFGASTVIAAASVDDQWQTVTLEEKIQQRVTNAIKSSMSGKDFVVSIKLSVKPLEKKTERKPAAVPGSASGTAESDLLALSKLDFSVPKTYFEPSAAIPDETGPGVLERIERLDVRVVVDNDIPEDRRKIIEEVVRAALDPFLSYVKSVKPVVKIDAVSFAIPEKPKPQEVWDTKRWVSEFKLPIGVLASTIALGFFLLVAALFYVRTYRTLEGKKIALMEVQNAREDAKVQAEQQARDQAASGPVEPLADKSVNSEAEVEGALGGFERFQQTMKNSPESAAALVRQWLKAPARGATEALSFLPKVLGVDDFIKLLGHLNTDERREWKRILSQGFDASKRAVADAYISSQIVESLLMPMPEIPSEVRESLQTLKASQCAEIAASDAELGAVMVSLLPTSQVAQMLALMAPDSANAVTVASLKMTTSEVSRLSEKFKTAAGQVLTGAKANSSSFVDRAAELLAEVAPDKEGSIFGALAESKEFELLQSASRQFFPSELISKLPAPVLRSCLERMPLSRRADLIYSRTDEKDVLLDAIGAEGSKVREMIKVELEQLETDDLRKRKIEKAKDSIWRDFVSLVRSMLRANESLGIQADSVLEPWLSEKSGGQIGKSAAA